MKSKATHQPPMPLHLVILFLLSLLSVLGMFVIIKRGKEIAIAQAPMREAEMIFHNCGDGKLGEFCYAKEFMNRAVFHPLGFALEALSALEIIDPSASGCHFIAHSIVLGEMAKDPKRWERVLDAVDLNRCTGGFVHGVVEGMQRYIPGITFDTKTVESICSTVGKKKGWGGEMKCVHITGHIVMVENAGKIPDSLSLCDKLKKNYRYECAGGVFMENETRKDLEAHEIMKPIPWNEEAVKTQEAICRRYTGYKATACWQVLSHMFVVLYHKDPWEVWRACGRAPLQAQTDACYNNGAGVLVVTPGFDMSHASEICQPFKPRTNLFNQCVSTVIYFLLASSPEFINQAITFCETQPQKQQVYCFQTIGRQLQKSVPLSVLSNVCQKLPEQYRQFCTNQ